MYQMGLIGNFECNDFSKIDSSKVIYRTRSVNPKFSGLLDLSFW